jgi:esterase/lipase superfamily enzyme
MYYFLTFREAGRNKGGAVMGARLSQISVGSPARDVEPAAFRTISADAHVVFLIHGFNVSLARAGQIYANTVPMLPGIGTEAIVVGVTWPGDSKLGFLSFPLEGRDADDTARRFHNFIRIYVADSAELSFVTHSLGARVAMETASHVRQHLRHEVNQVCLTAAAIDRDSLSNTRKYKDVVMDTARVAVLSSKKDRVLKYAYPVGDFLERLLLPRKKSDPSLALGRAGPLHYEDLSRNLKSRIYPTQIPKSRKARHGDYFFSEAPPKKLNANHLSTAIYAEEVILAKPMPKYP